MPGLTHSFMDLEYNCLCLSSLTCEIREACLHHKAWRKLKCQHLKDVPCTTLDLVRDPALHLS